MESFWGRKKRQEAQQIFHPAPQPTAWPLLGPSPWQVMEKEGVTRYDPLGDKFDPNLHNALFEVPDATKEVGTVAVVIKVRLGACRAWERAVERGCWGCGA